MDREIRREVAARLQSLDIPFNRDGIDPFGVDRTHLQYFYSMLGWFQKRYFRVETVGKENIPKSGAVMLVGNHSGGYAVDAGMVLASCFFDLDPPRLAHAMAEKFINRLPFASPWLAKTGQLTGHPRHGERLLNEGRLLLVFPEGARGTEKLYPERNSLVKFGTGFVRLAMKTNTPIVPFGFVGAGDAVPTVTNLKRVGKLFGLPYIPVTPYGLPLPVPGTKMTIRYGEPMVLAGTGNEDDAEVLVIVSRIKTKISSLIKESLGGSA